MTKPESKTALKWMDAASALTKNEAVLQWMEEMAAMTQPDKIVWITGEEEQLEALRKQAVEEGILIKLNEYKLPGCYLHRTDPDDVARVEDRTFICCEREEDAGPTNHWMDPKEMYEKMYALADGAYKGRTMYVIPYSMSIIGSPFAKYGFELTDSIYVVLNMAIMTRIGKAVCDALGDDTGFIKGLHCQCNLDKENKYIVHFPQDNTIISMNSNYGGNVLQGKKCFALRIASNLGRKEGWMAEHMLILGIQNPRGEIKYGIFMIGFYILGGIEGNSVLMEIQAFLFVMFVLCQFVYNQVSRLYEVFVFNEGKSEFPARRIMGINVLIMIVFGLLLVFGMLIFYHGRYGNIFSMIGMALLAIIKWILKLLLMLRGDDDTVMDDYIEETTTSPEPVEDEMDVMVNNAAGNALMEVVAIFLIIGVIILIIVTIVRYASRFRKSLDNDKDEVEYINNDEEKEYKVKKSVKVKDTKDKANIRYRKLYKKYAKSKKVVTKSKLAGAKVDSHMMPEEITSKLITDDEAKARRITDDYEKARYSNGEVSEEDISFLKNFK